MGTMSQHSFMAIDPLVDDPEFEHDTVIGNSQNKHFSSVQQQAAEGIILPAILVELWTCY